MAKVTVSGRLGLNPVCSIPVLVLAGQLHAGCPASDHAASSLTSGSEAVVGKGPLGATECGEEPQGEPGKWHEGNVHISVHMRQGWGPGWEGQAGPEFSLLPAEPPRASSTSSDSRSRESNKRRKISRPGLAGPVLLNLSSTIILPESGVGLGPGAPALSSPNQAPYPRASRSAERLVLNS